MDNPMVDRASVQSKNNRSHGGVIKLDDPGVGKFERESIALAKQAVNVDVTRSSAVRKSMGKKAQDHHEDLEAELKGLSTSEANSIRETYGYNSVPEKIIPIWWLFVKQLIGPMPYMIEVATVLAAALQQWAPFGILISILSINCAIGFYEEKKAKDALDGLKNSMVSTVSISIDHFILEYKYGLEVAEFLLILCLFLCSCLRCPPSATARS